MGSDMQLLTRSSYLKRKADVSKKRCQLFIMWSTTPPNSGLCNWREVSTPWCTNTITNESLLISSLQIPVCHPLPHSPSQKPVSYSSCLPILSLTTPRFSYHQTSLLAIFQPSPLWSTYTFHYFILGSHDFLERLQHIGINTSLVPPTLLTLALFPFNCFYTL